MRKSFFLFVLLSPGLLFSQQITDTTYNQTIPNPAYELGKGPIIFIDEGHYNLNTIDGRYKPFANFLKKDGYNVEKYEGEFNENELEKSKILVISNALNENVESWVIPNPSAFTKAEIEEIRKWVFNGGSLFLIADHMPIADASKDLAKEFGFKFTNGFVFDSRTEWRKSREPAIFSLKEKTLIESIITKGRNSSESVDRVASFTGQGFEIPEDATPILVFDDNFINLLPDTSWVFDDKTTINNANGMSQGAFKKYGKGRIVAFGEAAMFTAQLTGPKKIKSGMNSDVAPQNHQLLLNIIHWLDGKLN